MPYVSGLVELCVRQPFCTTAIEQYIHEHEMDSESVTRAAILVCYHGSWSYGDYLDLNDREPLPQELCTYRWDVLFHTLIQNGLDANLTVHDTGCCYTDILEPLQFLDDGDLAAKILRDLLVHGGNPNRLIDGEPFFEEVDSTLATDISLGLFETKTQLDRAVRFWLVLMGFGGTIRNLSCPVKLYGDYQLSDFQEYERFDYRITYETGKRQLIILEKDTIAATCDFSYE